ncbi:hypothetical protein [Burkholderia gladioli]|uniref:hypothetical protein n=1 Tax=Burkholderia gladioli TaxID=28095 RepID=UPI0016405469|nr:hypothetical protein [Burkholderia gladioli]
MKKTRMFRPARVEAKPSERWRRRPRMQRQRMKECMDDWAAASAADVSEMSRAIQSLRREPA